MKRILSLTLALALMAAVFTACGCEANVSTHPGGMITEETTRPTVMPTPTATHATEPRDTTLPTVNGSDPTDGSMPNSTGGSNGATGGTGSGSTGGTGSNGTNGNSGTGSSGGSATGESSTPTEATQNGRSRNKNTAR